MSDVGFFVDPLAEKYPSVSSYVYCLDNPVKLIDPDGKEVLNGFDKKNASNIPLLKAVTRMKLAEDPKVIHIYGHGNQKGFYYTDKTGKEHFISDAKGLVGFLKTNSKVWQNRKKDENITIVLHACETGKETDTDPVSFAQKVSKDMKNTTIIAPTENIHVTDNGVEKGPVKETTDNKGNVLNQEPGRYSEFQNGEKTNTYTMDAKVGTKGFNSIWNKVKQFLKR